MALLVDKHRPKDLKALSYHEDLTDRLGSLAQTADFPHLLMYGPSGAGKKTRVLCTLKAIFGPSVTKIRISSRVFTTPSNRKLDFTIAASNHHLEITPADVGMYDRVIIQDLLKEVAQTPQMDVHARQRFKVVVINEAELLSRDAQAALRRTMEKYSANVRLVLVASSTANIIAPIRSRCLLVRVPAPTEGQVCAVLEAVAAKEGWRVNGALNGRIAAECGRNLRRALLMFEAVYAQNETVADDTPIPPPDWELLISQIAGDILRVHTPEMLYTIRGKYYDLLTHCIPATSIVRTLFVKLVPELPDDAVRADVAKCVATFEHRLHIGNKPIFHLEAMTARIMHILESHAMAVDMDMI